MFQHQLASSEKLKLFCDDCDNEAPEVSLSSKYVSQSNEYCALSNDPFKKDNKKQ